MKFIVADSDKKKIGVMYHQYPELHDEYVIQYTNSEIVLVEKDPEKLFEKVLQDRELFYLFQPRYFREHVLNGNHSQ